MDQGPLLIQVILGTTRQQRFGEVVARWFYGLANGRADLEAELLDLRDWPLPFFDAPVPAARETPQVARAWAAKVGQADGYVFVAPEYNYGPPAVLKNALDHVYREWNQKPVAFVGYGGSAGGARGVQQLRLSAIELQLAPIRASVLIPRARSAFDEAGQPLDPNLERQAHNLLDQLVWWSQALRAARTLDS